jgi:hypothetical protein
MLTTEELAALIAWAAESEKPDGKTAWGPKFDAALAVAQRLRQVNPSPVGPKPCDLCGASPESPHWYWSGSRWVHDCQVRLTEKGLGVAGRS